MKKLKKDLEKKFSFVNEESAESIVSPNGKKSTLELVKCQAPSRMRIYLSDGAPIVIDHSGKGDYELTYFTLWRAPDALGPSIEVKHCAVTKYLVKGADFMLPGVGALHPDLPKFKQGHVFAIKSPGNPKPFAVGEAVMSYSEFVESQTKNNGGKFLVIRTCYRDALWGLAASQPSRPGLTPNSGFLELGVVGVGWGEDLGDDSESEESGDDEDNDDNIAMTTSLLATTSISPETMDAVIDRSMIRVITHSVKDKDLPMLSTVFWGQNVVPNRPADGPALDVKKSSHKKMSKLFTEKIVLGWITGKEDKRTKEMMITSVVRGHSDYSQFDMNYETAAEVQLKERAFANAEAEKTAAMYYGAAAAAFAAESGNKSAPPLLLEEKLRPPASAIEVFSELEKADLNYPLDSLYTRQEASQICQMYCEKFDLEKNAPSKAHYLLNPTLSDALFKGVLKKGDMYPTAVKKKDVVGELWVSRFHPVTSIKRGARSNIKKGTLPPVQIESERRNGDRKVTRVFGFETYLIDPEELRETLANKLAANCAVTDIEATKNRAAGSKEIVCSGNAVEKTCVVLNKHYQGPVSNLKPKDLFKGKGKNK